MALTTGCNDTQSFFALDEVPSTILYTASQDACESIEAAWDPTTAFALDDQTWIALDRASRHVVRYDATSRIALFDMSPYDASLHDERTSWSSNWGTDLIHIDGSRFIIADPHRKWLLFDIETGEVQILGQFATQKAAPGARLGDVDFRDFIGLGRAKDGFFIAFDTHIYRISWDGDTTTSLMDSPLIPVAGNFKDASSDDDALHTPLSFQTYTQLIEAQDTLYFWEEHRLRAVQQGAIATVTGAGTQTPGDDLDSFYAHDLPARPRMLIHHNTIYTPYLENRSLLLAIHVEDIDFHAQRANGTIDVLSPPCESIADLTIMGEHFLAVDSTAGSFWKLSSTNPDQGTRLFGPESLAQRVQNRIELGENSPYASTELLGPTAIQTWFDGLGALLYAPTFKSLNFFSFATQSALTLWQGDIQHLATDGQNQAWFVSNTTLHMIDAQNPSDIVFSYVPGFFKSAPLMGIPCTKDVVRLTEAPTLAYSGSTLLFWAPSAKRIFSLKKNNATVLHSDGWVWPTSETTDFYHAGLSVDQIREWKATDTLELMHLRGDGEFLAASNLTSSPVQFAGTSIPVGKIAIIAGGGTQPIHDGIALKDTRLDDDFSFTSTPDGDLILFTATGTYRADSDGVWQKIDISCGESDIQKLTAAGLDTWMAQTQTGTAICLPGSPQWFDFAPADVPVCASQSRLAWIQQDELCMATLSNVTQTAPHCIPIPDGLSPHALTCGQDRIAFSAETEPPESYAVYTATYNNPSITYAFGMGDGLPDSETLKNVTLGHDIGKIIPHHRNLILWMRDTCSLWKFPVYPPIEADTIASRLLTTPMLCDAQALGIADDGTVAFVHDHTLYVLKHGFPQKIDTLPSNALDIISIADFLAILASDGIYTLKGNSLSKVAPNPIQLDGLTFDYSDLSVLPRFTQSPDQNAVLIPMFERGRILRIAL